MNPKIKFRSNNRFKNFLKIWLFNQKGEADLKISLILNLLEEIIMKKLLKYLKRATTALCK